MAYDSLTHIPVKFPEHRAPTRLPGGQDFSVPATRAVEISSDIGYVSAFGGTAEVVGFRDMRDDLVWARQVLGNPAEASVAASGMSADRLDRIRQAFGG